MGIRSICGLDYGSKTGMPVVRVLINFLMVFAIVGCSPSTKNDLASTGSAQSAVEEHSDSGTGDNISDPWVARVASLSDNKTPVSPSLESFGMDEESGIFMHPAMTRDSHDPHPFDGSLDHWDPNDYAMNMTVEAYYPITVEPFHTWQNIVDFGGRRYLYQYVRRDLKIMDITDPKDVKVILTRGHTWGPEGAGEEENPYADGDMFGAASIQWNAELGTNIMVQAFEIRRFGVLSDKFSEPDLVASIRRSEHLKGFKVYAMNGPLPEDWELLAERTTDYENPGAPIGEQQGSGVRDLPLYFGGQYMFVAAAPSARHALTEYPNDLYSAGYQAWDMSDPTNPVFLDQLNVKGQIAGDLDEEAAYVKNPRAGNRTSWMGARMSLFAPTPVEEGGKYAYAAMGGLGFYVVDISNPAAMRSVGHLEFPPNVAGVESDYVDVSQVQTTGIVYTSGYPLNEDCWEPYKDIDAVREIAHGVTNDTFLIKSRYEIGSNLGIINVAYIEHLQTSIVEIKREDSRTTHSRLGVIASTFRAKTSASLAKICESRICRWPRSW